MSKPLYSLFALFIILMEFYADSFSTSSTLCAPSECNGVSIRYPFWRPFTTTTITATTATTATIVTGTEEFCGYPDFGLECLDNGLPILTLPSDTYYVKDINYVNHSITLVDIDVVNQPCPRAQHNVTLGTFPLSYSPLDLNLSFYFNCSSYPSSVNPIGCLRNSERKQSYVFVAGNETEVYDLGVYCEQQVLVPVKEDEIISDGLITGFAKAMNQGFVLDWRRAGDCAECEDSDGYCGYNQTSKQLMCICRDGRIDTKRCNKGTLPSAY